MKKILTEWRKYLLEAHAEYNGIFLLKPSVETTSHLESIQAMLPEEAVRIPSGDFHVTLIHQSILKPYQEEIKNLDLPTPPPIEIDDEVFERRSPGKKSWAVRVVNQEDLRSYVSEILERLGSNNLNPEPERRFHVSLGNLTGNPRDSVS